MGGSLLLIMLSNAFPLQVLGNATRSMYIIRHGEKHWTLGCLNQTGEARAKNLISVFNGTRFTVPTHIFANRYDDPIDCERCVQTVTPVAQQLSLNINNTYGYPVWIGGNTLAAKMMKQALMAHPTGSVLLAAWEHENIQFLTEDLGVPKSKIPIWHNSNYDSIYILGFDDSGNITSFHVDAEKFDASRTWPPTKA